MRCTIPPSLVERSILRSQLVPRDSVDLSGPPPPVGESPRDRVADTLSAVARTGRTVSTGGSMAARIAEFTGHPGTAESLRQVARPAGQVGESFGAASNVWQAGKVLGDPGATSAQKMTAFNNAVFSTMVAAGTVFPVTCGPMVMAGTVGLVGTELINRLRPEPRPGTLP